jgi:inosine-uridine nucleoside N-ribohydrolase
LKINPLLISKAERNVYNDPVAARNVFEFAGLKIYIVPLETAHALNLQTEYLLDEQSNQ